MALHHSPSLGHCFWSKGFVTVLVNTVTNCEDLANRTESGHGLHWVLTCLWEDSNNFIWNSWNLTQAAPLLKHLSVDHSTGAEPNCKSNTVIMAAPTGRSWTILQSSQDGAIHKYSSNWETGNGIYTTFCFKSTHYLLKTLSFLRCFEVFCFYENWSN